MNRRELLRVAGLSLAAVNVAPARAADSSLDTDLLIYGGTAGGVAAAVQARRMGKKAVIIEPGRHLGGLTSGGLGQTDIGNKSAIGGLSREFYRSVHEYYITKYGADSPQVKDCVDGFRFEPHVAEHLLRELAKEAGVSVVYEQRLKSVKKSGNRIVEIETEPNPQPNPLSPFPKREGGTKARVMRFRAKMFIDASYEGDLMAQAKVSYTVGREANAKYNETLNGVQLGHHGHQFRVPVDPFVIEGVPSSGVLKGVSAADPGKPGKGDNKVQAYCFRLCLTNVPENRVPFPKPRGYDPVRYTLYARYLNAGVFEIFGNSKPMPNGKTDTNNHGAIATDNIGMNYDYPNGDWKTRQRISDDHVTYEMGLFWFLCNDERVPLHIRGEVSQWGLAKDEFTDNGNWPHQLYVREARRMIGDYVMTEHNCRVAAKADDAVGLAAYNMDSHHVQRYVKDGKHAQNEGDVEVGVSPYPIAYRSIVPKEYECENLLVPVCLSSSHIAYGSIRMEPVFMVLGQSAATAAALAIDDNVAVQKIDYAKLRAKLLDDKQVLEWTGPVRVPVGRIDPKSLPGIVLDDEDGKKVGEWHLSTRAGDRRVGVNYVHDGNANKGQTSIAFAPDLPADGEYHIFLIFNALPNRAAHVPVTVAIQGGDTKTVFVNQREESFNGLTPLGTFKLPKGKRTTVTVSNKDTDGYVVVDGVQFVLL